MSVRVVAQASAVVCGEDGLVRLFTMLLAVIVIAFAGKGFVLSDLADWN